MIRFLGRLSFRSRRMPQWALAGLLIAAPPTTAHAGLVEAVEGDNPLGSLAVIGPIEQLVSSRPGVWSPVPGLATGVYSREGDALEITVSAETLGAQNGYLRAVVDGISANPYWVRFRTTSDGRPESRSFTFVYPRVAAGQHVVEMEWYSNSGTWVQMRRRTLAVQSASGTQGSARLAVASAVNELAGAISAWTPVPSMSTTLATDTQSNLSVTFSSELSADSGRFYARAVVDGIGGPDVLMAEGGVPRAPRSYTFVVPNLAPGVHNVRIDYHGQGGMLRVGKRALSAFAAPIYLSPGGGMTASGYQLAPTPIQASYVDVLSELFWTTEDTSSVILTVGAEVRSFGKLHMRLLIDGRAAEPGVVEVMDGDLRWRAQSFSFVLKNLASGLHSLKLQAQHDSWWASAYVGERFWRVVHKRRSGSEFAQPFLHPSRTYTQAPKAGRFFSPLVICFDPVRPAHPAPTFTQLRNVHEGLDAGLSAAGWYAENSGGRLTMAMPSYFGCAGGGWRQAPPEHQGDWYWQTNPDGSSRFPTMFKEALLSADAEIDYHSFDRNRDGQLTADEVVVEMVHPQNDPYGVVRNVSVAVDGIAEPLTIWFEQLYASADTQKRRATVGMSVHEMSHLTLRAEDLHSCPSTTRPGVFSIMDDSGVTTHLDPWHKLHSAFLTPALVETSSWATHTVDLLPVETSGQALLISSRARGDGEYFVVEFRRPSTAMHDDPLTQGVVVWHLFDDAVLAQQYPPPGGEYCGWDRNSVRKQRVMRVPLDSEELVWADGTPAGIRVTWVGFFGEQAQVEVATQP